MSVVVTRPARVVHGAEGRTIRMPDHALVVHHEHTIVIRCETPRVVMAA